MKALFDCLPRARVSRAIVPSVCLYLPRVLAAAALAPALTAVIVEAQTPRESATISGVVANAATHEFLANAKVRVQGTNFVAVTDRDGSYSLSGITPGTYTVVVNYSGLDEGRQTVTVSAGTNQHANFDLSSQGEGVIQLTEFVVSAEKSGDAKAVNRQKNSATAVEIVSSDKFGSVTEGNVGEFLKNLPGMQINYVAADARTVSIRGQSDNFTIVTMDGNQPAQAASSLGSVNRNFEFEQINIQNIETIEVYKVPTPAQSPAIGGTVNLVSKSAFDRKNRLLEFTVGLGGNAQAMTLDKTKGPPLAHESYKLTPGFTMAYADSFRKNTIGLAIDYSDSLQYNPQYGPGQRYFYPATPAAVTATGLSAAATTADSPGFHGGNGTLNVNNVGKFTKRRNLGINMDFKLTDTLSLTWRNNLSTYRAQTIQMDWNVNTAPASVAPGYTFEQVTFNQNTGNNFTQTAGNFDKYTTGYGSNVGFVFKPMNWRIAGDVGFSKSTNRYEDAKDGFVNSIQGGAALSNVGFTETQPAGAQLPTVFNQTAGASYKDLANYKATQVNIQDRHSADEIWNYRITGRRDFNGFRFPFYLETGYTRDVQLRHNQNYNRRFTYIGPDGVAGTADDTAGIPLAQFASDYSSPDSAFAFPGIQWINYYALGDYFNKNPNAFAEDLVNTAAQSRINDKYIKEIREAGYFMGNMRFGSRFNVLTGVRQERTADVAEGAQRRDALAAGLTGVAAEVARYSVRVRQKASFTPHLFKNLQLKYDLRDNVVLRGSYYDGEARQNFGDLIPNTTINDTAVPPTVTVVPTSLLPQLSKNYEVDIEYYSKPAGVISVAWYQKDIKNYVVNAQSIIGSGVDNGFGGDYIGYTLNTRTNAGDGHYRGVEIEATHQFSYLPYPFNGLSGGGSFSYIYEMSGLFAGSQLVHVLPGIVPKTWNLRLGYRTLRGKLYVEVRENVRGKNLNTSAVNAWTPVFLDRYNEQLATTDLTVRYSFSERWSAELSGRNIFEKPTIVTQGGRLYQYSLYGAQYNLAVKARF